MTNYFSQIKQLAKSVMKVFYGHLTVSLQSALRSQFFQSPIILRDPEQTNHSQTLLTRWEGKFGVTIIAFFQHIYIEK